MVRTICIALAVYLTGFYSVEPALAWTEPQANHDVVEGGANPVMVRHRGGDERPVVADGLQARIFASNFDGLRAMAADENGNIYGLESGSGRIKMMSDRGLDGQMDVSRVWADGFISPTDMVYSKGEIIIVDQRAIWSIGVDGAPKSIAALSRIKDLPSMRRMAMHPDGKRVILALTHADQSSRLISVNRQTGEALELAKGLIRIDALAVSPAGQIWIGSGHKMIPVKADKFDIQNVKTFTPDHVVNGIYFPEPGQMPTGPLAAYDGHFLVLKEQLKVRSFSQTSHDHIEALENRFGLVGDKSQVVADGFMGKFKRSRWGKPIALYWDARGLFIADQINGEIWLIENEPPKLIAQSSPDEAEVKFYESDEIKKPQARWGSSIESGSLIATGSSLSKDWENEKLVPNETLMEKMRREDEEALKKED